jgi:hypothetical protein
MIEKDIIDKRMTALITLQIFFISLVLLAHLLGEFFVFFNNWGQDIIGTFYIYMSIALLAMSKGTTSPKKIAKMTLILVFVMETQCLLPYSIPLPFAAGIWDPMDYLFQLVGVLLAYWFDLKIISYKTIWS